MALAKSGHPVQRSHIPAQLCQWKVWITSAVTNMIVVYLIVIKQVMNFTATEADSV